MKEKGLKDYGKKHFFTGNKNQDKNRTAEIKKRKEKKKDG